MFRGAKLIGISALLLGGALLTFALIEVRQADIDHYEQLVEGKSLQSAPLESLSGQQFRSDVIKDLFIGDLQGGRRQMRLMCKRSLLALRVTEEGTPLVVETMKEVRGLMQESLFYRLADGREVEPAGNGLFRERGSKEPCCVTSEEALAGEPMQAVRYFEADKASLHYNSNRFVAKEVRFRQYTLPSHQLIDDIEPFPHEIAGVAQAVDLHIGEGQVDLRAHRFEGTFFSTKELL